MTSTDVFGTPKTDLTGGSKDISPEQAATALGDILGFFHGEAMGSGAISQGIGATDLSQNQQTTTTTTSTPDTTQGNGQAHASPVPEGTAVSQPYGAGNDHDSGGHPGIDFAVPLDTPLLAAASGTVTNASNSDPGGYGLYVEITTDDGFKIRYGHLHSAGVQVGQRVNAGQVIGNSGGEANGANSGNSKGPHLHFEVDYQGHPIDPTPFLAGGYQILGAAGQTSTTTTSTPDPKALAAVQLQNVVNGLGNKPIQDINSTTQTTTTSGGQQDQAGTSGNFAQDVLKGIGAPVTAENIRFMEAWMRAEGGASHNNPLNTTQGMPGATDFNSVGVKTYTSYEDGVRATIQTLTNGLYGNIIQALMQGNSASSAANALANSPWGTGALVQQILGGG